MLSKLVQSYIDQPFRKLPMMLAIVQVPAVALAILGSVVFQEAASTEGRGLSFVDIVFAVVAAPLLETFIIAIIASVLLIFKIRWTWMFLVQGVFWGWVHSVMTPIAAAPAAWAFIVFSYVYVLGKTKGFWSGFGLSAGLHAVSNLIAISSVVLLSKF